MGVPSAKHPTRATASPLDFLDHLDGERFEQFCVDLLNLHPQVWVDTPEGTKQQRVLHAERLAGGQKQRGADIRAHLEGGQHWMLQCKRVKEFGPSDVQTAVSELEHGHPNANRYVLICTHPLSATARDHLNPNWECWDSHKLTTLVRQLRRIPTAFALVERYFGRQEAKRIFPWGYQLQVDWQDHFARDLAPETNGGHLRTPWVSTDPALDQLEAFARNSGGKALLLVSHGGLGKTRILLELARRLTDPPDPIPLRFLHLREDRLSDDEWEVLAHESEPTVVVLDDAHRHTGALATLAQATARSPSLRLIVTTRPAAESSVKHALYEGGYQGRIGEAIRLLRWTTANLLTLALSALDPGQAPHAPRLVQVAQGSPLLVVLGAQTVNQGGWPEHVRQDEAFRHRVFESSLADLLSSFPEPQRADLDRLIKVLSLLSPMPSAEDLSGRLARLLERPASDIDEGLDRLKAGGFLVEHQHALQIYPNLLSDLVLMQTTQDTNGKLPRFCTQLLPRLRLNEFPGLLRNLGLADWYGVQRQTSTGAPSKTQRSPLAAIWEELKTRYATGTWEERESVLRAWVKTAHFQPERSLQLADLVCAAPDAPPSIDKPLNDLDSFEEVGPAPPAQRLLEALRLAAAILEPVAVWHPDFAPEALDRLWRLGRTVPWADAGGLPHPWTRIASAASYGLHKPLEAAESVINWLEQRLPQSDAQAAIREHPELLGDLIEPFFGRSVEEHLHHGHVLEGWKVRLNLSLLHPFRSRALRLADGYLRSGEPSLMQAALPVFRRALQPARREEGFPPDSDSFAALQASRREALQTLRNALPQLTAVPAVLWQLRTLLIPVASSDRDAGMAQECQRLLAALPDTFELRLVRAIASSPSLDDAETNPDPDFETRYAQQTQAWERLLQGVARECVQRWTTGPELTAGVEACVRELQRCHAFAQPGPLLQVLASLSPAWAAELLDRLMTAPSPSLDSALPALLLAARTQAPEAYANALHHLPAQGTPARVVALIHSLMPRPTPGESVPAPEQAALLQSASRPEPQVVTAMATWISRFGPAHAGFSITLLPILRPSDQAAASACLRALRDLIQVCPDHVSKGLVTHCLRQVTEAGLPWLNDEPHLVHALLQAFPQAAFRNLSAQVEAGDGPDLTPLAHGGVAFGVIHDPDFLIREIERQWQALGPETVHREARLSLIRGLIQSDPTGAPARRTQLLQQVDSQETFRSAVELLFPVGGLHVLHWPSLAALALEAAPRHQLAPWVWTQLLHSALGGPGHWIDGQPTADGRTRVQLAQDLSRHPATHPDLAGLYREIAEAETRQNQRELQAYHDAGRDDAPLGSPGG